MNLIKHLELNAEGIPKWLECVVDDLIDNISPKKNSESENELMQRRAKIWIHIPEAEISSYTKFNDWFVCQMSKAGFRLLLNKMPTECEIKNYYTYPIVSNMYVDLSGGVITKYMNVGGECFKSGYPTSFENIAIHLCGDDGRPPYRVSLDKFNVDHMMNLADIKSRETIVPTGTSNTVPVKVA